MNFYFVTAGNSDEIEVIRKIRPKRLMCSYHYFKTKGLKWLIEQIGYQPEILIDSGAYSAFNSGKVIAFEKYMEFIKVNKRFGRYISLDVVNQPLRSYRNYLKMKKRGLNPIPVFHYLGDEKVLERYINKHGEKTICLGGTVPIKDKGAVADWVRLLTWLYPNIKFHVLGTQARKVLDSCDIESADAATWVIMASKGFPRCYPEKTREAKIKRMEYQMKKTMEVFG